MNSKQKNILIGGLLAIVLILGVAYAAFQSQLNITGTSTIDSKWDVRIISITPDKIATNSGTEASPNYTTAGDISHSITNNDLTANFNAGLVSPGDTVVYTIKVKNNGTLNAALNTLTKTPSTNPAITFEVSGIEQNDILNAGAEKEFTVTVAYANVESQPTSTSASFSLTLDFVQTNSSAASTGGGSGSSLVINQIFVPTYYEYHTGSDVAIGTWYDTSAWTTNPASLGKDYYLGHAVDESGNVTANYVCFILDDTQYCMRGMDGYSGTNYWDQNEALLGTLKEAGTITCPTFVDGEAICSGGSLGYLNASNVGGAIIGVSDSVFCYVDYFGGSACIE